MNRPQEEQLVQSALPHPNEDRTEQRLDLFKGEEEEEQNGSLRVGETLGAGAFNRVVEVVRVQDDEVVVPGKNEMLPENQDTGSMKQHKDDSDECHEELKGVYALKRIRSSIRRTGRLSFVRHCSVDLEREGKLLSELSHPNIVKLHSNCVVNWSDAARSSELRMSNHKRYLLLERLYGTVEERLMAQSALRRILGKVTNTTRRRKREKNIEKRQYTVALPVASALLYLHEKQIVYRDLKPDNVGFDESGVVKIFDFGLARPLPASSEDYKITPKTGSYRYMAPEVFKGQPYGLPVDVYSYGLFLWQVSSLERPFGKMNLPSLRNQVYYGRVRPQINSKLCGSNVRIRSLMQDCWQADPSQRPSFCEIERVLQTELPERGGQSSRSRR